MKFYVFHMRSISDNCPKHNKSTIHSGRENDISSLVLLVLTFTAPWLCEDMLTITVPWIEDVT